MEMKLELIVVPVTDVDRAKTFYLEGCGFKVDIDHRAGEHFRVVQMTPAGSSCSISLMANPDRAGTLQGLHLVTHDIEAARAELADRGVEVSGLFHFTDGGQTD